MKSEREHRKDIVEIGRRMWEKGFVVATDGNISVKMADDRILTTPSGVSKGHMRPEEMVVLNSSGVKISGEKNPSSEFRLHLAVYAERPDVFAVIHAHPPVATAFTIAGISLAQCVIPEVVFTLGSIPTTEYATPTTDEGPKVIRKLIHDHDALILDRHGTVTVGPDIFDAYKKLEKVEHAAEVTLAARQLGKVKTLPPEEVQKLLSVRQKLGLPGRVRVCSQCGACGKAAAPNSPPAGTDEDALVERITQEVLKALGKA
jgi:L-fuculose-phosphate aldolase